MPVSSDTTARWLRAREAARAEEARQAVEAMRARLPAAVALLRARFGVGRAWLFGSYASGAVHDESDVDLLVEGLEPTRLFTATAALMPLLGRLVHLVRAEEAEPGLLERVRAEGAAL